MNLFKRCDCLDACKHPYWYRFRLNGRQHRGTTKTNNRQIAQRLAGGHYHDALEGKTRTTACALLSTATKQYVEHVRCDQATIDKTERVLTQFETFTGDRRLGDVSPFLIEKWKLDRSRVVKQSTVNRELNVVKGFFTCCVKWKLVGTSTAIDVKKYKIDDVRVRVLTSAEIQAVLTDAPANIALLCRATLECLPRLSELLMLRREHIGGTWIEVRRKGGRVQRLPVTAELRAALLALAHEDGYIFGQSHNGKPPTQQAATNSIVRWMAARGVLGASHHTFRHTGVTLMLEAGVNPRAIQQLAGWTSLRMLERYGHVRDAETRRAVTVTAAAVEEALATKPVEQEKHA